MPRGNGREYEWGGADRAALVLILAAFAAPVIKAVCDFRIISAMPEFFPAEGGAPFLTSHDAWHFLLQARLILEEGTTASSPALALLTAFVSRLGGWPLEWTAFWLGPALALAFPAVAFAWGTRLGGRFAGGVSALVAACSPIWMEVTALGRLDTDCLIPPLLGLAALPLAGFARADLAGASWRLAGFALTGLLAVWWWRPSAGVLGLSLLAALAARGVDRRGARLAACVFATFTALGALTVALGWHESLPAPLAGLLRYVKLHAGLALRTSADQAAMADSIMELAPATFAGLAALTAGWIPALLAALAGLALVFAARPREAAPLLPPALCLFAAFASSRMALLFVLPMAVGLGFLAAWATGSLRGGLGVLDKRRGDPAARSGKPGDADTAARSGGSATRRGVARALASMVLTAFLIMYVLLQLAAHPMAPPLGREAARLALAAREASPPGAVIWSWWDYGYFLAARARLPVFFDGGSQTLGDAFVAAYPLASSDPVLAANWMLYFARAGQGEFERLAARAGSPERALELLARLFSGREDPAPLAHALGGGRGPDAARRFFPPGPVCLALPKKFLDISGHWIAYATPPGVQRPPALNRIDALPAAGLKADPALGGLTLPDAARAKGYEAVQSAVELGEVFDPAFVLDGRLADPILFYKPGARLCYITDSAGAASLAFWLLAPTGFSHPAFKPVFHDPAVGGVWLVDRPPGP
jgi:undecaprenyl-diphosphooligosaccharide--protein glycosyltransferase